jgi:uncharacterized protein involved in type VI secretion and phage assembly
VRATFHGIVGRIEVTGQAVGETHYRIELVPSCGC